MTAITICVMRENIMILTESALIWQMFFYLPKKVTSSRLILIRWEEFSWHIETLLGKSCKDGPDKDGKRAFWTKPRSIISRYENSTSCKSKGEMEMSGARNELMCSRGRCKEKMSLLDSHWVWDRFVGSSNLHQTDISFW